MGFQFSVDDPESDEDAELGETSYNRKNIIQGQTDVPLSTIGEKQARLAAKRLQNDRFTHVFASDLSRASHTAKIITDGNKVCRCEVAYDKRLRERNYGTAEGKSTKELLHAARRARRKLVDYTPPGAESVEQIKERMKSFFDDLCKLSTAFSKADEQTGYTPGRIKRRHGGSLGRNSGPNKRFEISRRSQSFCGSGNPQNILNKMSLYPDIDDDINHNIDYYANEDEFTYSMQAFEHDEKMVREFESRREFYQSSSEDSNLSSDLKLQIKWQENDSSMPADMSTSPPTNTFILNSSESDSTLSGKHTPQCNSLGDEANVFQTPSPVKAPRSEASSPSQSCPNVSLSPILQQRLPSVSSISSGRNSSFDELDGIPAIGADILVVSHGGFLRECVKYLVNTLDCKIPGIKSYTLKVCPNCSISKFNVNIDEETDKVSLTCVTIHDKDHLIELDHTEAPGMY